MARSEASNQDQSLSTLVVASNETTACLVPQHRRQWCITDCLLQYDIQLRPLNKRQVSDELLAIRACYRKPSLHVQSESYAVVAGG